MEKDSSANNQVPGKPEHSPIPAVQHSGNKKVIVIAVAVTLTLALGSVAAYMAMHKKDTAKHSAYDTSKLTDDQKKLLAQDDPFAQQYLKGCKDRQVSFTQSPVPTPQLGQIEPMGKVQDGHVTPTDHMYVGPNNPQAPDNTFDVVMPADGTVISVQEMPAEYIGDKKQQTAPEDHRLVIAHNCQYVSIFIHVHKLSDTLDKAVGGKMEPNTQKEVSIELKAGDKLGKIGGNPVDWSLMDAKKTLSGFITPDLYKGEPWKVHVIDAFSMYTGDMKTQMVAKAVRNQEPYGGKIDYDKKGALIGNWFREGTNGYMGADQSRYWDGHLSIAPDYVDTASTVLSVGNWDGKAAQFVVKGKVDPAATNKASGMVKYEVLDRQYMTGAGQSWMGYGLDKGIKLSQTGQVKGTALVQVLDGEKLKVQLFPGKTATQVSGFTSAAQTYTR